MKTKSKFLIGIQIGVLTTVIALPVQAAVNIGAPQTLSGSVVTLRSSVPVTTPVTSTPTQAQTTVSTIKTTYVLNPVPTQSVKLLQTNSSGNVVYLKTILKQPTSTPVKVTSPAPAPTPTPATTNTTSPVTTPTTPTLPVIPTVSAATVDEQLMVDMINQERIAAGISPVKLDLRLTSVGRAKANDMVLNNYFDHTSPTYGSPWAMMANVGLPVGWAGENISGNKSVEASMASLMLSPGHKANILDPRFTHVGVGVANGSAYGHIYVQEFLQE